MQKPYIQLASGGFLPKSMGFVRLTALGIIAGFLLFFHSGEGLASPGAAKADPKSPAASADRFAAIDKNGDGKIVIEEFQASSPGMSERAFAVIDVNGDGFIDRSEWAAFMKGHAAGMKPEGMPKPPSETAPRLNNIPGDPLIPPPGSADLPLMRPPSGD